MDQRTNRWWQWQWWRWMMENGRWMMMEGGWGMLDEWLMMDDAADDGNNALSPMLLSLDQNFHPFPAANLLFAVSPVQKGWAPMIHHDSIYVHIMIQWYTSIQSDGLFRRLCFFSSWLLHLLAVLGQPMSSKCSCPSKVVSTVHWCRPKVSSSTKEPGRDWIWPLGITSSLGCTWWLKDQHGQCTLGGRMFAKD